MQTGATLLCYASVITEQKNVGSCWLKSLASFKLRATTPNNTQQYANRVCKRTQQVTHNNVGRCWPTMLAKDVGRCWPTTLGDVGQGCWEMLATNVGSCWPTMLGDVGQQCWEMLASNVGSCSPTMLGDVGQRCWEMLASNVGSCFTAMLRPFVWTFNPSAAKGTFWKQYIVWFSWMIFFSPRCTCT